MILFNEDANSGKKKVNVFVLPDGTYCKFDGKNNFIPFSSKVQDKLKKEQRDQKRLKQAEDRGEDISKLKELDKLRHQFADETTQKNRKELLKGDMFKSNMKADDKDKYKKRSYFKSENTPALTKMLVEILHDVIANEILPSYEEDPEPYSMETQSYERIDQYHDFGPDILLKGNVRRYYDPDDEEEDEEDEDDVELPLVLIYFDRSGSFNSYSKIQLSKEIENLLESEEFKGEIDLSKRYFKSSVYLSDPGFGGGTSLPAVLDDAAEATKGKLANVIILTDEDDSYKSGTVIPISGSVFLIYAAQSPSKLARNFVLEPGSVLKEFTFSGIR